MSNMFRPDWDPFDHIQYLDMMLISTTETVEKLAEQQAQTAWMVEQLTDQLKTAINLLNSAVNKINEHQRRIEYLEALND